MARQTIIIGAPGHIDPGTVFWPLGTPGQPIDATLLEGEGPGYLTSLVLRDDQGVTLLSGSGGVGSDPGPDLSTAWETSPEALSILAGGQRWTFPGPGGTDDAEPYHWQHIGIDDFLSGYNALTDGERAATFITLDDGQPLPPGTVNEVSISLRRPLQITSRSINWSRSGGYPPAIPEALRETPGDPAIMVQVFNPDFFAGAGRSRLNVGPSGSLFTPGPDLSTAWETSPEAVRVRTGGGESWVIPGPDRESTNTRDTSDPYSWSYRQDEGPEAVRAATAIEEIVAWWNANPTAGAILTLSDYQPPPVPGYSRPTPMAWLQATLAAVDDLPPIHPHLYRGPPREPAIVALALGGEGMAGIGFDPQRNVESIRLESRAATWMAAEAGLDLVIGTLRGETRTVAVDGTSSDYDPQTEVYRAWATIDVRR